MNSNTEWLARGEWMEGFGFVVLVALNLVTLVKMFAPQRRDVSVLEPHARREELHSLATRLDRAELNLEASRRDARTDRDALLAAVEIKIGHIHERLNDILAAVSELKGKINARGRKN